METRLHYSTSDKHLSLAVKEKVSTDNQLQLKFGGLLNTTSGNFQYRGAITKNVSLPSTRLGSGGVAGIGFGISSSSKDEPFATAFLHQPFFPLKDKSYSLHVKAGVDYAVKGSGLAPVGSVYAVKKYFNFTDRHDLRFKAGVDASLAQRSLKLLPRLQVRENNWTLDFRGGKVNLFYDL